MEDQRACPKCGARYGPDVLFCPKHGAPLGRPERSHAEDPYLGLEVAGQFRIEQLIGIGAMGRVYRAHQRGIERPIAIKILHRDLMRNSTMAARLQREAKVASRLTHPNVVHILMTGELEHSAPDVGGETYLAMEYLDGISLRSALAASGGALPLPRALHVALQFCDAVGEAHNAGVIHRDLKPENVMLVRRGDDRDFVKVLDFGVARLEWADATVATQAGVIFGTARYISPEGARGEPVTASSDVYSLAVILFECLAGATPFEGDSPVAILIKHTSEPAPELRTLARASYVPEPIARVIAENLAKDPRRRSSNARELGKALVDAARRSGLRPDDLVVRSTLLGERGALALTSIERTRSLALSPDLEAKLQGGAARGSGRTQLVDGPAAAPPEGGGRSTADGAAPRPSVEPTISDEPAAPLLGSSNGAARPLSAPGVEAASPCAEVPRASPRAASASNPGPREPAQPSSPGATDGRGESSLAAVAHRVKFPDAVWDPPADDGPRSRRWALVIACFGLGALIALVIALRIGIFEPSAPGVNAYAQRASAAVEAGAWDAPPGENVKDITDAALARWPAAAAIVAVRREAAQRLLARAELLRVDQRSESLRLARLASELDQENPAARRLIETLSTSTQLEGDTPAPGADSAVGPGQRPPNRPVDVHPPHERPASAAPSASSAVEPDPSAEVVPAPSSGGRWL